MNVSMPSSVELHDESGAHTLSATVEWFFTRIVSESSSFASAAADTPGDL